MAKPWRALSEQSTFAGSIRIVRSLGSASPRRALYLAEQTGIGRACALRVLDPRLISSAPGKARFEELKALRARIKSDHVVDVVAAGVDRTTGAPWFALDHLEGETLSAHAASPLPSPEALERPAGGARARGHPRGGAGARHPLLLQHHRRRSRYAGSDFTIHPARLPDLLVAALRRRQRRGHRRRLALLERSRADRARRRRERRGGCVVLRAAGLPAADGKGLLEERGAARPGYARRGAQGGLLAPRAQGSSVTSAPSTRGRARPTSWCPRCSPCCGSSPPSARADTPAPAGPGRAPAPSLRSSRPCPRRRPALPLLPPLPPPPLLRTPVRPAR